MSYTVEQFAQASGGNQHQPLTFELPQGNDKMLLVNFGIPNHLHGQPFTAVWMKAGAMVAYTGDVKFEREKILSHGVKRALKKTITEEGKVLTRATANGRAQLYLAQHGKIITVFKLRGETITVNGNDLLAFDVTVTHRIVLMKSVSTIISGGLFSVRLSGHGSVAVMTHGKPICLSVGRGLPTVYTDPDATVAWTNDLSPEIKSDVQFKTFFGRGSGESFQMKFDGKYGQSGLVLVQPFEEKLSPSS